MRGTDTLHWSAAATALASAAVGAAIAAHHPLAPPSALLLFVLMAAGAWLRPDAWIVLLPALLPVAGLATWTGWITFEEFDLLVLAAAAGSYARLARRWLPVDRANAFTWMAIAAFAADVLFSMFRGFADAGGFEFGWFQGYREPMNSLRLAKPLFAALLLWPLWRQASQRSPQAAADQLSLGMLLGLLAVSLMVLWERLAFTGLLNFSSDYRTTALFWEMHVGGAALDGYLALVMPFALHALLFAPSHARWCLAAGVGALGLYACLTTFSRGVYAGIPIGLGAALVLQHLQWRRAAPQAVAAWRAGLRPRLWLLAAFAAGASCMFAGSGYRGLMALMGALVVLLPLAPALQRGSRAEKLAGFSLGVVVAVLGLGLAWLIPKGPYVVHGAGVLFALGMLWLHGRRRAAANGFPALPLALTAYLSVLASTAYVALHWGGERGLLLSLPVVAGLLLPAVVACLARRPPWPVDVRWQGNTLATLVAASALVAALGGGAYLGERFSTTTRDLDGRIAHWRLSLSMLDGPWDMALGKGLGRYVDSYGIAAPERVRPGDYRLRSEGHAQHVLLVSGRQMGVDKQAPVEAFADVLRLSQRTRVPEGAVELGLRARSDKPASLGTSLCAKHLLYTSGCVGGSIRLEALPGQWQQARVSLKGALPTRGDALAPRLIVFSIGLGTANRSVDIDELSLTDAAGHELLSNGDFSAGLAHWYITSDRDHLPWHAKNMPLHVVFDQGLLGLALLGLLLAGALLRTSLGSARAHPLAPPIAGALLGFAAVGMFDSLLDVPRVAWLFYWLLLLALTLKPWSSALVRPR